MIHRTVKSRRLDYSSSYTKHFFYVYLIPEYGQLRINNSRNTESLRYIANGDKERRVGQLSREYASDYVSLVKFQVVYIYINYIYLTLCSKNVI